MRKIILMMSVSLDGFIEGPNREIDWHMVDDELHGHVKRAARRDRRFPGRTCHLSADGRILADSRRGPLEHQAYGGVRPHLAGHAQGRVPRTLERADWNATVVREVVADQVMELKAQPGGDMVLGGADIAATFMRLDLIDEYRIYVHPVVIGGGKPLFPASQTAIKLQLAETRTFGNGVVLLRYQRPDTL